MEEGVNDWKNAHSKFCWHKKSSIHIEAVSKLLENRNEKDIIKLFGQEDLKQDFGVRFWLKLKNLE